MKRKRISPSAKSGKHLNRAWELHRAGNLTDAKRIYEKLLENDPECVEAHYLLGRLYFSLGDPKASIASIRKALALKPEFVEAQNDLGNLLHESGRLEEAASVFRRLVHTHPNHADAYNNLGVVLKEQDKFEEAISTLQQAVRLDPTDAGKYYNLGNVFKRLSRFSEAAAAYHRVLELAPSHADAHRNLVAVLRREERIEESEKALRAWHRQAPEDPIARHMLAACTSQVPPLRASNDYVRQVFDRFADTFDEDLQELGYLGPEVIAAAVSQEFDPDEKSLHILDAGCGTGICSQVLRHHAGTLTGVDLSPAMLEKARRLNTYDALVNAEIIGYLKNCDSIFDLIVFADTVNYFGALNPLMAVVNGALRTDGCVIFTCERDDRPDSKLGYRLGHHGRYSHTIDYVTDCVGEAGLTLRGITQAVIRHEAGLPVAVMVARARKIATDRI